MAEEDKPISWSLKDGLLVVPFFASALALTWEVGFFFRVGGAAFSFFSIAEHVSFSIRGLPLVLIFVSVVLLFFYEGTFSNAIFEAAGSKPSPSRRSLSEKAPNFFLLLALFSGVTGFLSAAMLYPDERPHIIFRTSLYVVVPIFIVWLINRSRSWVMFCFGLIFAFALAFGTGADNAQHDIESKRPLNVLQIGEKGSSQSSEMHVRVLRSGEHGVLFFDPASRSFGLIPWDVIKRMDWGISSILSR